MIREVHKGIVSDNNDPQKRGRIRVTCSTLAPAGANYPIWVEPAFPFMYSSADGDVTGFFFVPYVGATIELEIDTSSSRDGSQATVSVVAPNAKYRCQTFGSGFKLGGLLSQFGTYPDVKGIETKAGALVMVDTRNSESITLISSVTKNDGATFLTFQPDGSIALTTGTGQLLNMDTTNGVVTLIDDNQNMLVMNSDGWYVVDDEGDMVQAKGGIVSIFAGDSILMNASGVNAQVSSFSVQMAGLDTAVIKEGIGIPFSTALAQALTEIMAIAPSASGVALVTALGGGVHTSTRLTAE